MDCYRALAKAYAEEHRFYHTGAHINAMLQHFDTVASLAERPGELELAIWFHDAIYKPLSSTNEIDSAEWTKQFLYASDYHEAAVERVYNLVMATLHQGDVKTHDEKMIVDIDLTILGAAQDIYDAFERKVRSEYKFVPSFIFQKKRREVLESFLSKDSIYHLDFFQDRFETAARANLSRAIATLKVS